jgi:hypothetical protein
MRMIRLGRVPYPRKRRWLAIAVAVLAVGGAGAFPSAVLASSSSVPTWTKQAPPTRAPVLNQAAMAYDGATGTAVLHGCRPVSGTVTSTWDGSTWTQQAPATHPRPRQLAPMVYDAATDTAVLAGGYISKGEGLYTNDTWTWG